MKSGATSWRVLVTGSAGALGRHVVGALVARGHFVRGYDLAPTPAETGVDESVEGDLNDPLRITASAKDIDTIVHLAAQADEQKDFLTEILPPNVKGLYRVCEAAREGRVRRLVLASSIMVCWGLPWRERTITLSDGVAPTCHYAMTKIYAEQMGRMYARRHDLSCVAMRIGWLPRNDQHAADLASNRAHFSIYLSTADAGRAFVRAVESTTPDTHDFAPVFITSQREREIGFDPQPARDVIGYEAQDEWPENLGPGIRPRKG